MKKGKRTSIQFIAFFFILAWTSFNVGQMKRTKKYFAMMEPPDGIFIDVGANCGNSYWKLKKDPKSGILDSDKWETYLWECNPQMNTFFLRDLANTDPSIHLIEKAASTEVSFSNIFYRISNPNLQAKLYHFWNFLEWIVVFLFNSWTRSDNG